MQARTRIVGLTGFLTAIACGSDDTAPSAAAADGPLAIAPAPTSSPPAAPTISAKAPWAGLDLLTAAKGDSRPLTGARLIESDDDHAKILIDATGNDYAFQRIFTYQRILGAGGFEPRSWNLAPNRTADTSRAMVRGDDVVVIETWNEGKETWASVHRAKRPAPAFAADPGATFAVATDDVAAMGEHLSCAINEVWTFWPGGKVAAEALEYGGRGTWSREGADLVAAMTWSSEMSEETDARTTRLADATFYVHGTARWLLTKEGEFACAADLESMDGITRPDLLIVLDAGGGAARTEAVAKLVASDPSVGVKVGTSTLQKQGLVAAWRGHETGTEAWDPAAAGAAQLASMVEPYGERVRMERWPEAPYDSVLLVGAP